MRKQETIRGILEKGLVTWYSKNYDGVWTIDRGFVSTFLDEKVRRIGMAVEFRCSIDRDSPYCCIIESDIAYMDVLSESEKQKTMNDKKSADDYQWKKAIEQEKEKGDEQSFGLDIKSRRLEKFLNNNSPASIAQKLNEYVLGQEELTKSVSDFLYYHALRLKNPSLPQRPLLIAGPSGSGKTEVWRIARTLYGHIFKIKIVNGAKITQDGWKGNTKTLTFVDSNMADGGILVVDEFDKLAAPQYSSGGDNVADRIQSEFLKLLEGEEVFFANDNKSGRSTQVEVTSKTMGFVLVGAFDKLLQEKECTKTAIGFGKAQIQTDPAW